MQLAQGEEIEAFNSRIVGHSAEALVPDTRNFNLRFGGLSGTEPWIRKRWTTFEE
jgi:hypothetical protein